MAIEFKDNHLTFPTGKRVYAYSGIIGMSVDGEPLDEPIAYGYDGCISTKLDDLSNGDECLTLEEMLELANHMIGVWSIYRNDIADMLGKAQGDE